MTVPITAAFTAFFALALVALSLPVTFRRIKVKAEAGDAGDETLRRLIRAQGNFTEYVPLGLIALGLAEAAGATALSVHVLGGTLVAGRVLHAVGMLAGVTSVRASGMILTYVTLVGASLRLIGALSGM